MRRVITLFALLFIGLYSNAQDSWNAVKVFELDAEDDVYSIYIDSVGTSGGNAVFCFQTDSTNKLIKTDFKGDIIEVTVGEVIHPMDADHYIEWIAHVYENRVCRVNLKPGDVPTAKFAYKPGATLYAMCNKHGLWKVDVQ